MEKEWKGWLKCYILYDERVWAESDFPREIDEGFSYYSNFIYTLLVFLLQVPQTASLSMLWSWQLQVTSQNPLLCW